MQFFLEIEVMRVACNDPGVSGTSLSVRFSFIFMNVHWIFIDFHRFVSIDFDLISIGFDLLRCVSICFDFLFVFRFASICFDLLRF